MQIDTVGGNTAARPGALSAPPSHLKTGEPSRAALDVDAAEDCYHELGELADSVIGFVRQLSSMAGNIRSVEKLVTASLIGVRSPAALPASQDLDAVVGVLSEIVAQTSQLAQRTNLAAIHTLVRE